MGMDLVMKIDGGNQVSVFDRDDLEIIGFSEMESGGIVDEGDGEFHRVLLVTLVFYHTQRKKTPKAS